MMESLKKSLDFRIGLGIVLFCLTYLLSIRPSHCPEKTVIELKLTTPESIRVQTNEPIAQSLEQMVYKKTPLVHKGWSGAWPSPSYGSFIIA